MLSKHEAFVKHLEDEKYHLHHKKKYDDYSPSLPARIFGKSLIGFLNLCYGKKPSYQKFKAIEVVARIPYQTWEMVSYWLMTFFFTNQEKAIALTRHSDFGKIGQDNETMHVVVISQICREENKGNVIWHTLLPVLVSHIYFVFSYILFFLNKKFSYELNFLFEGHAYSQYNEFIHTHKKDLESKPVHNKYLEYYGRSCKNQYELFKSIRNDELIHRNNSIEEIEYMQGKRK